MCALLSFGVLCCSVLSLPFIKDGLQQHGKGGDGTHVQVSKCYEQVETRFNSLKVFQMLMFHVRECFILTRLLRGRCCSQSTDSLAMVMLYSMQCFHDVTVSKLNINTNNM